MLSQFQNLKVLNLSSNVLPNVSGKNYNIFQKITKNITKKYIKHNIFTYKIF